VTDVVVVGGGVIGLASAWRVAQRGASVAVVDAAPAQGASYAAAGMLCPVNEVHYGEKPLLQLNIASSQLWPSFAAELEAVAGLAVGYRSDGTLAVAFDDDDLRVLEELLKYQLSLGLSAERLRSRECRALEPHLSPRLRGGVLVAGDHQVDNRRLLAALLRACERCGVRLVRQAAVAVTGNGVTLDDGERVAAGYVVLAAGCWSATLAPELPVRPVKGQILRLHCGGDRPLLTRNVRGQAEGRSVYLVPREDGELVVGATVEDQGFDTVVTAGAAYDLLRAATDLVPDVRELELAELSAGLRPGTPDNAPIIGPAVDRPHVVYATGHYRNGVLLTPVTADAVAAMTVDATTPAVVAPFGIGRFGG
jgi:glycine oxidase